MPNNIDQWIADLQEGNMLLDTAAQRELAAILKLTRQDKLNALTARDEYKARLMVEIDKAIARKTPNAS